MGGQRVEFDLKSFLRAQWRLKMVTAFKNGIERQSVTQAAINIQVIIDRGHLELGSEDVSTESILKTDGPQSVNSMAWLSSICWGPSACLTRAEAPSAPRLRAPSPPMAAYFAPALSPFCNFLQSPIFAEALLMEPPSFGRPKLIASPFL